MNKIQSVLNQLESIGKQNYMFNIQPNAGKFLNLLIKIKKPKTIIEVGTSNGYSTIWIASALKNVKVITVEQDEYKIKLAEENFKKSGLKNIKIIKGNAIKVIPEIKEKADLIFIDAAKREYIKYFKLLEKNMNKGCIILADNIISHSEKIDSYLTYVNKKYNSITLSIGSGLELTLT